jgi:hypothetical protein
MSLDVYVGSLTRYYLDSPLTISRAAVLAWRDGLHAQLGSRLDEPLDWDESPDGPSFTDKARWEGYGGALLLAAHVEHPRLPVPDDISPDWPDDPAYLAVISAGTGPRFDQVLLPEMWLPCRFAFTFRTRDATGQGTEVGSSPALLTQLEVLRDEHPSQRGTLGPVAHAGLAVLLRMAECSVRHRVPMKLDF